MHYYAGKERVNQLKTLIDALSALISASGYTQLESRVNNVLNRADLVCSWLVTVVEPTYDVDITTLSFQEFRKVYKKPQLFYRDIYSPETFARIETEASRQDFECQGGKFLVL